MKDFTQEEIDKILKICKGRTFIANCVIDGCNINEEPVILTTENFYISDKVGGEKIWEELSK